MPNHHGSFRHPRLRLLFRFFGGITLMLVLQGCAMVGVELVDSAELAELKLLNHQRLTWKMRLSWMTHCLG